MYSNRLRPLYNSMLSQQLGRCKFNYRRGRVTFKVIFFIEEIPFKLLFGVSGYNQSFELSVFRGFQVNDSFDAETWKKLCEILELHSNPYNRFSTRAFLEEFNKCIPQQAKSENRVKSEDIAPYEQNVVEPNKVYFCGWHDNVIRGEKVRPENLEKTRKLLGLKTYETCLKKNISSCWTDDFSRACEPNLPK